MSTYADGAKKSVRIELYERKAERSDETTNVVPFCRAVYATENDIFIARSSEGRKAKRMRALIEKRLKENTSLSHLSLIQQELYIDLCISALQDIIYPEAKRGENDILRATINAIDV